MGILPLFRALAAAAILLCLTSSARAERPRPVAVRVVSWPAVRIWPVTRVDSTFLAVSLAELDAPPLRPAVYPLTLEPVEPKKPALAPARPGFSLHKISAREHMDRGLPTDRHAPADRYSPAAVTGENVYVIEFGHDANVVAYGRRYSDTGGEGKLHLGEIMEASGSALLRRDGQVSIVHNIDLKLTKIAVRAYGLSMSPFVRGGFLIDFYPDGVRRGTIVPGAGLNFTMPSGYRYPLRFGIMASPEIGVGPGRGPPRWGGRAMVGAEILMF